MNNFFTARGIFAVASILLVVLLLSFPGKTTQVDEIRGDECALTGEPEESNELFWESLSRQFSGSATCY